MESLTSVLLSLARQMYDDIRFITEQNPTQVVDEDTARMFNNLLAEVRVHVPSVTATIPFSEMSPRTLKYKDALVVIGQLTMLLRVAEKVDLARIQRKSMVSRAESEASDLSNDSLDESLEVEPPPRQRQPDQSSADVESSGDPRDSRVIHDEELYGSNPVMVNEDGTVPFVLDDEGNPKPVDQDENKPQEPRQRQSPSGIQQLRPLGGPRRTS